MMIALGRRLDLTTLRPILAAGALLAAASSASAQCLVTRLPPSDLPNSAHFGRSADLDGTTLLVGAFKADGVALGTGAAYVFANTGTWGEQQKIQLPFGVPGDEFGLSVSLDGDRAAIGAPGRIGIAGADQGAVYVFERNGGVWTESAMIVALDAAAGDEFGTSVALDGDTLVVGAVNDVGFSGGVTGSAYVFIHSAGQWLQQSKLLASDGQQGDDFGAVIGLSGDTAAVGAPVNGSVRGAVYVYERVGTTWTEQAKLVAGDAQDGDQLGWSVAVAGDVVISGAPFVDASRGAAYVFRRTAGTWSEEARLVAWDRAVDDAFGSSVALDLPLAVVGSPESEVEGVPSGGALYVFAEDQGAWRDRAHVVAPDAGPGDRNGTSVGVSGDLVAGLSPWKSYGAFENAGAAYVFDSTSYGVSYGVGCPGTGDVAPGLRVDGCPDDGVLDLRVYGGLGPSFGQLWLGLSAGSTPIAGSCELLVQPLLPSTVPFQLVGFGPGIGEYVLSVPIPANAPAGTATLQAAIFDPFAAPGFSVTNGVEVTIP